MEVFVCTIPSSLSTQAVLYGLLDVELSVNSLSIRVPALFSYVEIPVVTSISAGFQIDRSALIPTLTVTGTGFGIVANEIDLSLQVVFETLSCLSVRFVRRALV